jgi:hypothetical protein
VVVDAVRRKPVSTPNSLLAGNLAGNFWKNGLQRANCAYNQEAPSMGCREIPCSMEQGIFCIEQGI